MNVIHGANGAGKTNVLEAVHYLCLGRSFLASKDRYALQFNQSFFELKGRFQPGSRAPFDCRIVYKPDEGKRAFINGAPLERLSDLVGRAPVVVLAPGDIALTDGAPEERRRFLDNTLSQARAPYLNELLKYRRTMRQRNAVLSRGRSVEAGLLEPWNAEFSKSAARITLARRDFVSEFSGYLDRAYEMMDSIGETPSITYRGFIRLDPELDFEDVLDLHREQLRVVFSREKEQRRSLVGPHRDELVFRLNGVEVRRFASQGQHRTFGMALQLAKYLFLRETRDEKPLLLLDDVFGDLDRDRSAVFLALLENEAELGQTLITGADQRIFLETVTFDEEEHSMHLVAPRSETPA